MTQTAITSEAPTATEGQVGHIKDLLNPTLRRLNGKQAQAIIEAGNMLQQRFEALVLELVGKLANIFMVTVDYSRNLPEMTKAGRYDFASEYITAENFPVIGEGKAELEIVLVHFDREMESDDVLAEFEKLGLRAITLPELLAFGETHPEVQREFPIVALGSVWADPNGDRRVPYLGRWYGLRRLRLYWFESGWRDGCRFGAVRK